MLLLCSTGAALAAGPPDAAARGEAGGEGEARARFEAALELVGHDDAAAVERLEAVGGQPGDYAPDALMEAARLLEDRLGRPDRARALYAQVVARYPGSRLSLRARARVSYLDAHLGSGAGPLGDYQRILSGYPGRPPAESRRLVEQLLSAHPDFSLADQALLWLAADDARAGRCARAEAGYAEVERRFPGTEAAALAEKGRGDCLLSGGRLRQAEAVYGALIARDAARRFPGVVEGARAGLASVARARARRGLRWAALALLVAYLGAGLVASRPLWPLRPGRELAFYLPVAAAFTLLAALSATRAVALATLAIALGGAAITWVAGRVVAAARAARRPPPLGWPLFALATVLAVLALSLTAVHAADLTDLVVDTLRDGPER